MSSKVMFIRDYFKQLLCTLICIYTTKDRVEVASHSKQTVLSVCRTSVPRGVIPPAESGTHEPYFYGGESSSAKWARMYPTAFLLHTSVTVPYHHCYSTTVLNCPSSILITTF